MEDFKTETGIEREKKRVYGNFDPRIIKRDFPILERKVGKNSLVYLDNAATTQKPIQVISALNDYYIKMNSNVHRGLHTLAEE